MYFDEVQQFLKGKAPLFEKELALMKKLDNRGRRGIGGGYPSGVESSDMGGRGRSYGGLSGGDMQSHAPSQFQSGTSNNVPGSVPLIRRLRAQQAELGHLEAPNQENEEV